MPFPQRTPVWESQSRTMLPPGGGPPLAIVTPLVVTTQFPFGLKAAAVTSSLCASRSVLPLWGSTRSACWPAMRRDRSPILDGAIWLIGKPLLPSSATAMPDATSQPLHWPALRMPITEPSGALSLSTNRREPAFSTLTDKLKLTSSSENQCEITHPDHDEGEVLDMPGTRRHDSGNAGTVQKRWPL